MQKEYIEQRIIHFRKNPKWGSQIFMCMDCGAERIYGEGSKPDNIRVLIVCEGSCKKNTMHSYVRTHMGREMKNCLNFQ